MRLQSASRRQCNICLVLVRAAGVAQGGSQAGARCGRDVMRSHVTLQQMSRCGSPVTSTAANSRERSPVKPCLLVVQSGGHLRRNKGLPQARWRMELSRPSSPCLTSISISPPSLQAHASPHPKNLVHSSIEMATTAWCPSSHVRPKTEFIAGSSFPKPKRWSTNAQCATSPA